MIQLSSSNRKDGQEHDCLTAALDQRSLKQQMYVCQMVGTEAGVTVLTEFENLINLCHVTSDMRGNQSETKEK